MELAHNIQLDHKICLRLCDHFFNHFFLQSVHNLQSTYLEAEHSLHVAACLEAVKKVVAGIKNPSQIWVIAEIQQRLAQKATQGIQQRLAQIATLGIKEHLVHQAIEEER